MSTGRPGMIAELKKKHDPHHMVSASSRLRHGALGLEVAPLEVLWAPQPRYHAIYRSPCWLAVKTARSQTAHGGGGGGNGRAGRSVGAVISALLLPPPLPLLSPLPSPLPSPLLSPLPSPLPSPPSDLQDGRRLQQAGVQQCADFVAVIPIQVVLTLTDPMPSPAIAQMLEDMPSELDNDDGKTFVEKALDSSTHAHTGHSQGLA